MVSAKVSVDADHASRGYGFVALDTHEGAAKAIEALHDKPASDTEPGLLAVTEYVRKSDRDGTMTQQCGTNLYVKNFPAKEGEAEFTEEMLKESFSEFGDIVSVIIMRDEAGKSRGFGFVSFAKWTSAKAALDKYATEGKPDTDQLYVAEAKSKEQRREELARSAFQFKRSMQLLNLIVRGLSPETTKEEFDEFFGQFGTIRSSKVVPESQIGFVCYTERESARKAKEM